VASFTLPHAPFDLDKLFYHSYCAYQILNACSSLRGCPFLYSPLRLLVIYVVQAHVHHGGEVTLDWKIPAFNNQTRAFPFIMATVVVQQHQSPIRQSPTPPPLGPALTLNIPRTSTPIPNKHIPYCPAGSPPLSAQIVTPPNSPPAKSHLSHTRSVLHTSAPHIKLLNTPPVFGIDAKTLSSALDQVSKTPIPDPFQVFPWLHGLHSENQIQLAFFVAKKKWLRRTPKCLRAITVVKAGGDLSRSRLKGSVAPDEILSLCDNIDKGFMDCDPREGFSVRNFHIQAAKIARVSDIVIYGDENTDQRIIKSVAERASMVQRRWRKELEASGQCLEHFHTFVLTTPFDEVERHYPELVAVDSSGKSTEQTIDFLQWERFEMCEMSKASELAQGVYQGPTPDWNSGVENDSDKVFDVFIEASDQAQVPNDDYLTSRLQQLDSSDSIHLDFPSSGSILPPSWSTAEVDGLICMCRWIYNLTHPGATPSASNRPSSEDRDGDIQMTSFSPSRPRKVLIHCADGYTESTLLSVAYYMYAEGVPVQTAWLQMHCQRNRNFFAYPSDVALLTSIQARILSESPARTDKCIPKGTDDPPSWLNKMDGSLPSRILPYMYLGNLTHANNPELLWGMGIRRVLSIGEAVSWDQKEKDRWGAENLVLISKVQDNGIDPLTEEFERCLDFIGASLVLPSTFPTPSREKDDRGHILTMLPHLFFQVEAKQKTPQHLYTAALASAAQPPFASPK
jgi:dual specificity MAP kinase phosphatase